MVIDNKYVNNIRAIVREARQAIDYTKSKNDEMIKFLRKKLTDDLITDTVFKKDKAELEARTTEIERAAIEEVNAEKDRYFKAVTVWETPCAERIVPDMQLLSGVVLLTKAELIGLAEKHRANPIMIRALKKYATENQIVDTTGNVDAHVDHHISALFPDGDAKRKAFDTVVQYAHGAISQDWYAPTVLDDGNFAKIYNANALDGAPL